VSGATGTGKTTLLNILERHLFPSPPSKLGITVQAVASQLGSHRPLGPDAAHMCEM
jgi:ABC-type lipoprotein export system ATPase subunit